MFVSDKINTIAMSVLPQFPVTENLPTIDDELPEYTENDTFSLAYTRRDPLPMLYVSRTDSLTNTPLIYSLRQTTKKTQLLLPFAAAPPMSYAIKRNNTFLSSKADFVITKKACTGADITQDLPAASIRYSRSNNLPYIPRATITYVSPYSTHEIVSKNLANLEWLLKIDHIPHYWRLMVRPVSLALINLDTNATAARFVYSERGTFAKEGQEIGRFEICPGVRGDLRVELLEQVLCSACVVIAFGKDLGKPLANRRLPAYEK